MAQPRDNGSRERSAARAETQKEARDSYVMPQVGVVYPGKSAKGFIVSVPVLALLGALVALPFAAIAWGEASLGLRLIVFALAGAFAGGVVGAVAGPAIAARREAAHKARAPRGAEGRPGKAEIAEATHTHESDHPAQGERGRARRRPS